MSAHSDIHPATALYLEERCKALAAVAAERQSALYDAQILAQRLALSLQASLQYRWSGDPMTKCERDRAEAEQLVNECGVRRKTA